MISLALGCIEGVFQIDIYDNGVSFPLFVLDYFGERGNTDRGTGHGIPDILEFIQSYGATYKLTEYEDNSTFTKGISIIWDNKNQRLIESNRDSKITKESIFMK